jgi:hypothetical protein
VGTPQSGHSSSCSNNTVKIFRKSDFETQRNRQKYNKNTGAFEKKVQKIILEKDLPIFKVKN